MDIDEPTTPARNKVVITHILPGLRAGGVERILENVVRSTSSEFDHRIVSISEIGLVGSELKQAGYDVTYLDIKSLADTFPKILQIHQATRSANIIHSWIYHGAVTGCFVKLLKPRVPLIMSFHATDIRNLGTRYPTRLMINLSRSLSGTADSIIYCSPGAQTAHEEYGFSRKRNQILMNGVDTEIFKPLERPRAELRAELGLANPERPLILVPARFSPQKDHETTLKALSLVRRAQDNWSVVLCGNGIHESNEELCRLIVSFGLTDRIVLGGEISDMRPWYQAADVLLLGSAFGEAIPMVILEGMASGTIVVSTNVGDIKSVLGGAGFLAPPRDPHLLALELGHALRLDPFETTLLAEASRARVDKHYSKTIMVSQYVALYRQLMAAQKA